MKFGIQAQLNPPIKVRIEPEPEVENKVEVKLNQTKLNWAVTQLKLKLVLFIIYTKYSV